MANAKTDEENTPQRKDVCVISIMFPVTDWDAALETAKVVKKSVANVPDVSCSLRLQEPITRPSRGLPSG